MRLRGAIVLAALAIPAFALAQTTLTPSWCQTSRDTRLASLKKLATHDPWFEVYSVAPGVFALFEPRQAEQTISYLIIGSQRALLFDTGMGIGDLKALVDTLTTLPVVVLNSHTHNDHVGSNWQFTTVLGIDSEFTRRNALGSRPDAQAEIAPGQICGALPPGFDPKTYQVRPWKITSWIHGGDRLDLGNRSVEILATPGHTPDSISLFDSTNGLLFTGDTYYPGTIWLYRPETDLAAYQASIRHLAEMAPHVQQVFGAHNHPGEPPTVLPQLVSAFVAARQQSLTATPSNTGKQIVGAEPYRFLLRSTAP